MRMLCSVFRPQGWFGLPIEEFGIPAVVERLLAVGGQAAVDDYQLGHLDGGALERGGAPVVLVAAGVGPSWSFQCLRSFKDRLLKLLDPSAEKAPSGRSHSGAEFRDHGEKEAARIVRAGLKELALSSGKVALSALPKSDERKVLLASLLRERTCVSNACIATRLGMGHPGSVSRMVSACRKNKKRVDECNELAEILSSNARSFQ